MKFVFMGSDYFGIKAMERLVLTGHSLAGIVSTPPRLAGRGLKPVDSQVASYAAQKGNTQILTPENLKDAGFLAQLKEWNADFYLVAAYRILPPDVFNIPQFGAINIHASLLPRYRGPAPIQRAIQAGEKKTGVTMFSINAGIDTGRILSVKSTDIKPHETSPELYERLSCLGAESAVEAVASIQNGNAIYIEQDNSLATRAPKLLKAEGLINWAESSSVVFNKIRAFKPFPGCCTFLNGRRISVEWGVPLEFTGTQKTPGTVTSVSAESLDVMCGDGALRIFEVKPEGKKKMNARDFINGARISAGMVFG
jgi:methionyl-tRNA formyltransferase